MTEHQKSLRKNRIPIRVSDEEKADLIRRSGGGELATWMRETCLATRPKHRNEPPKVDPILIRQIAYIGNNLNQIARSVNRTGVSSPIQIYAELEKIEKQLDQILEIHSVSKNI